MSNEIIIPEIKSPENLLAVALERGASVEAIEKLLAMRTQLKQEQSKEQYYTAMAKLQAEMPPIAKTKAGGSTKSGHIAYYYAPLDVIVDVAKPIIAANGFSYVIKTEMKEGKNSDIIGVKVTCETHHIGGHAETTDVYMPNMPQTNIMTITQVIAATITMAKRYVFSNAFGILTCDEDTDAQHIGQKPVQQPQSKSKAQPQPKPEDELPVFHEPVKDQKFVTNVHKITKKGLDFRILGDEDIIYTSRHEPFATLAKSAKEAGLKISGTHREFIILDIDLVEPKKETQQEFLKGLDEDAVRDGLRSPHKPDFDGSEIPY